MKKTNVAIKNIEFYLPSDIESRNELLIDNPDWNMDSIEEKTGVINRYVSNNETGLDMAIHASNKLLASVSSLDEIDALIYITQSPEHALPTTACILQDKLNLSKYCMAFDINLGCSGFVYGLGVVSSLIEATMCSKVLLVCSDRYTQYIDKHNRTCRPLFSDGASATLIESSTKSSFGPFLFKTDGGGAENLMVTPKSDPCIVCNYTEKELFMDGSQVFMYTMNEVPKSIHELLDKADISLNEIDLFIFHQASKLVLDNLVRRMKLPEEKVFRNYQIYGNTVSSTIPIALKNALKENKIKPGNKILLAGFGVGLSLGITLIEL